MTNQLITIREKLRQKLKAAGFNKVIFSKPLLPTGFNEKYSSWLAKGYYGQMSFLKRQKEEKLRPDFNGRFKSVIITALSYYRPSLKFEDFKIALYAQSRDYHYIIGKKLKKVVNQWRKEYPQESWKISVDWGGISEKGLGLQGGLGFLGENHLLINQQLGSFFFIGVILSSLNLPTDNLPPAPLKPRCQGCHLCQVQCPTQALSGSEFKANRCLAYLTIEHKGPIPLNLRPKLNNWLLGCDDCQLVCPYNQNLALTPEAEFLNSHHFLVGLNLRRILLIKDKEMFWHIFKGTPFMRAGWENIIRNACYLAGNQKRQDLVPILKTWQKSNNETIKEATNWALHRITNQLES